MIEDTKGRITQLLHAVADGNASAREQLWALVYEELHRIAQHQLSGGNANRTLQPTSLVHEAHMRLTSAEGVSWANRRHFFAAAAQAMRCIRVDDVRKRNRLKRGGSGRPRPLESEPPVFEQNPSEVLAIDEALQRLEEEFPRQAEIAKLRYFVGLTIPETADALGLSARTVDNDWRFARAWLHRALSDGEADGST